MHVTVIIACFHDILGCNTGIVDVDRCALLQQRANQVQTRRSSYIGSGSLVCESKHSSALSFEGWNVIHNNLNQPATLELVHLQNSTPVRCLVMQIEVLAQINERVHVRQQVWTTKSRT